MASEPSNSSRKVVVHVRSIGDAPILKQTKFKIAGTDKFAKVIDFLRRQLHRDTLFVYINSAFSPNPDELVIDLYNKIFFNCNLLPPYRQTGSSMFLFWAYCQNFGFDGKLVVNYACSMAWG